MEKFSIGNSAGFTILEVLVASSIFSIALLALMSSGMSLMTGNSFSKRYTEATVLAQSTVESLRYTGFKLGPNGVIDSKMTPFGHPFSNPSSANDNVTDNATLFATPDHAYTYVGGVEKLPVLDTPALVPTTTMRRAWIIRDDIPSPGMKGLTVIIGWKEKSSDYYMSVTTAIQGQ